MATTTPNLGLTIPTGAEHVSRQIINDNMQAIDNQCVSLTDYNERKTDYMTLVGRTELTSSYVTIPTYNNRKISDYTDLVFVFDRGDWCFGSVFCIRAAFVSDLTGVYYVTRVGTSGEFVECDVKYVDDTHVSVKKITNDQTSIYVRVYALCNTNITR